MRRHLAQVALPDLARPAEEAQKRELGHPQASAAEFRIVEPGHRAGGLPKGRAEARCHDRSALPDWPGY